MTAVFAGARVGEGCARRSRRLSFGFLLWFFALGLAGVGRAQDGEQKVVQHAYTLLHQPAREAVPLVLPLLSSRGGVEVRAGSNTLIIRDTAERLHAILPVLRALDHVPRALELTLRLVQAEGPAVVSPPGSQLPPEVMAELQRHLPFQRIQLLAETHLESREQQQVAFSFGERYHVRFTLGTVLAGKRLRLYDFEVRGHDGAAAPLVRASLNLWLGRTLALGLPAEPENDDAMLLVVLSCRESAGGGQE